MPVPRIRKHKRQRRVKQDNSANHEQCLHGGHGAILAEKHHSSSASSPPAHHHPHASSSSSIAPHPLSPASSSFIAAAAFPDHRLLLPFAPFVDDHEAVLQDGQARSVAVTHQVTCITASSGGPLCCNCDAEAPSSFFCSCFSSSPFFPSRPSAHASSSSRSCSPNTSSPSSSSPFCPRPARSASPCSPRTLVLSICQILPLSLLSSIISFLPFQHTVTHVHRVCHAMMDACHSPLAFENQRIVLSHTSASTIVRWAPYFTLIRELDLAGHTITEHALSALTAHVSRVKRLRLAPSQSIARQDFSRVFTAFSHGFRTITHLTVHLPMTRSAYNPEHEADALLSFAQHLPRVTSIAFRDALTLRVPFFSDMPPVVLQRVIAACGKQLTRLHWDSFHTRDTVSDEVFQAIAQYCPRIQDLRLLPAMLLKHRVTDTAISTLASGCPCLHTLSIQRWRGVTVAHLSTLLTHCKSLHHLILHDCDNTLTPQHVNPLLAAHAHVTRLSTDCGKNFGSPHITHATLFAETVSRSTLIAALRQLPCVRVVKVRASHEMRCFATCADLVDIKGRFPNVEKLVFDREWLRDAYKSRVCFPASGKRAENSDYNVFRVVF